MKVTTRVHYLRDFTVRLLEDDDSPMRACVTVTHSGNRMFGKGFLTIEDATRAFTELSGKVRELSAIFQAEHDRNLT